MTLVTAVPSLEIVHVNHASLLLVMGSVRLLTDPWFEGTAFDQGWALRWDNPEAYATAATATHLWISHPHSDHLHHPTLKRLQALNPDMTVIANQSYNYDLEKQMRQLGFHMFQPLREMQTLALNDECTVQRIGSSIIDSLLIIRWKNLAMLNLNDCVLQKHAMAHMARTIGPIDLLMCNFNHAGKLMHYPEKPPEQVRNALKTHYRTQVAALKPRCVVPFASLHRYLSPLSQTQNASLLEPSDLAEGTKDITKTIPLYPAQHAKIDFSDTDVHAVVTGSMPALNQENAPPENVVQEQEFTQAIATFQLRIARSFGVCKYILPPITLKVVETQRIFLIRHGRVTQAGAKTVADCEAHAEKILHWFAHPFGTDAFVVGAHITILRPCIGRLKCFFALLLLAEAKISPRYCLTPALWKFLLRRRHQAFAALFSWRVSSSYQ